MNQEAWCQVLAATSSINIINQFFTDKHKFFSLLWERKELVHSFPSDSVHKHVNIPSQILNQKEDVH
jgi:hypothetical protein